MHAAAGREHPRRHNPHRGSNLSQNTPLDGRFQILALERRRDFEITAFRQLTQLADVSANVINHNVLRLVEVINGGQPHAFQLFLLIFG